MLSYKIFLNSVKIHPERITKADRSMVYDFDYIDIEFPALKKDHSLTEKNEHSHQCILL